jgi:hypothetical protein
VAIETSVSPGGHHVRELVRVSLQQLQLHVREFLLELRDDRRQRVARLRMGHAHGERAARVMREFRADRPKVREVGKNAIDGLDDFLPGIGHRGEAPPLPHEDAGAQLFLERADLLRHPGLGRCEGSGPPRRRSASAWPPRIHIEVAEDSIPYPAFISHSIQF